jgi:hypothetical protein
MVHSKDLFCAVMCSSVGKADGFRHHRLLKLYSNIHGKMHNLEKGSLEMVLSLEART